MNKNIFIGLIVIAIIAIGGYLFPRGGQSILKTIEKVGATPGQEFPGEVTITNGRSVAEGRRGLTLATTTPCSVRSPSATSTLVYANVQVNTASSTATTWTIAKATTQYATTTELARYSLASGAQGSMTWIASSTPSSSADGPAEIKPNTYIVWGMAGVDPAAVTSDKLLGTCSYEFSVH